MVDISLSSSNSDGDVAFNQSAKAKSDIKQNQNIVNLDSGNGAVDMLGAMQALQRDSYYPQQIFPFRAFNNGGSNVSVVTNQTNNNSAKVNAGSGSSVQISTQANNQSQVLINQNSGVTVITGNPFTPYNPPYCPPVVEPEPPCPPTPTITPPVHPTPDAYTKIPCIVHDSNGQEVLGPDGKPIVEYYFIEQHNGIIEHPLDAGNYYRLTQYETALNGLIQQGNPFETAYLQAFKQIPVISENELSQMPQEPWPDGYFQYS